LNINCKYTKIWDTYNFFSFFLSKTQVNTIDTERKGNAWWIFHSFFKDIDEPVTVLPCDIITRIDVFFIYRNYMNRGKPVCMFAPVIPVEGIEGDYIHEKEGLVYSLSREKKSALYYSGIQVVNPGKICRPGEHFNLHLRLSPMPC
jgi:hypothetical protein